DMIIAGIETTVAYLEWTMSLFVRNPQIANKLHEEIEYVVGKHSLETESDLGRMEYLQCVVKQSLGLYPLVPLSAPHESTEVCGVGWFILPKKTRLLVNVWVIGRDPVAWEYSWTFKPKRFMGKDIDIEGRNFNILPFGAGRRGFPRALMGHRLLELMFAQLMHCFY
ncbi:hypothetical protein KI387_005988, partial [Taxus chinensis]